MIYLKDLKYPFLISGLILIVSVLQLWRLDFYAVVLTISYLILGSISKGGSRYFDLTQQKKSSKAAFKTFIDPPGVFVLLTALFYAYSGEFNWIFVVTTAFLTILIFAITFSDWSTEKDKEKANKVVLKG